jgi:hypothetical protein
MQQTQGGMARDVDAVSVLVDIRPLHRAYSLSEQYRLNSITETEREKIIDWLSPANFFLQQEAIFGRRQAGTGQWLLEEDCFKQWKTGSGEILWGRGAREYLKLLFILSTKLQITAGAGKTVLA